MMSRTSLLRPPIVRLIGHVDHPDFCDSMRLLEADVKVAADRQPPELVIIAQSRPGAISEQEVLGLRRELPVAGIVGLLGSWCEGETRTGKPWPGVARVYWHEFPAWWRRQLALRADGRCPDWARLDEFALRIPGCSFQYSPARDPNYAKRGLVVLCTQLRDTADALSDVFRRFGYATVWQRPGLPSCSVRGAAAGIWDGGQLDAIEATELARFCRLLARDTAPVVAMLDFPRRHSVDLARELGASAVVGKPWHNEELIATIQAIIEKVTVTRVA